MGKKKIAKPTEAEIELYSKKKKIIKPKKNSLFGIDIIESNLLGDNQMVAVDTSNFLNKISSQQTIEILPSEKRKELNIGWTVAETIGIGVYNPGALSGISIYSDWKEEIRDIINEEKGIKNH